MVKDSSHETDSLVSQIREDWIAHGKDWTKPGFRAVVVHRFGVWRMTLRSRILRGLLGFFYRIAYRFCRNIYGIELPYSVVLGRRVIIEHQGNIVIHGSTVIGDDTIIRQGVTAGLRYLDRPLDAPNIGNRVNIGAGAQLLGAIEIGDGATIGANAVVLGHVDANRTVAGIPAREVNFAEEPDEPIVMKIQASQ